MTHVSEERNVPAPPEAVWRVIADTKRWPQFYATPKERGKLRMVEYLDGATQDGEGVKRRLAFAVLNAPPERVGILGRWPVGLPSWDEQATRWRENDGITWLGIRNPGMKYWTQQLELIPGRGFTTLRWDVFYEMKAPRAVRKAFKRTMEEIVLSSLARVERLAVEGG